MRRIALPEEDRRGMDTGQMFTSDHKNHVGRDFQKGHQLFHTT